MATRIKNLIVRNKFVSMILIVVVLVMGVITWRVVRGPSPDEITQNTIRALENGDAKALCALADPEELRVTRLNPEKVEVLLRETLWQGDLPRQAVHKGRLVDTPVDQGFWAVRWSNKQSKHNIVVVSNDHPKNGWHLNLSWMLYSICVWKEGGKGSALYREFARKNGVVGFRAQDGVYNDPRYFGDLAQIAQTATR